jgi:hypothetical protein
MLVATGQGNVYLVREHGPFWRSRPGRWLIVSSVVDLAIVTGGHNWAPKLAHQLAMTVGLNNSCR